MDTLISFGGEIKTLEDTGDSLKIGGYLVLFGSPEEHDATRLKDYFTKSTDFDIPAEGATSTVYYHHGLNASLKARPLGRATLRIDDAGVWMESELKARDDYERKIQDMVRQGKLGLSSGTASHLVERTAMKNAQGEQVHRIDRWPLGLDASLTPTPGEPRTWVGAVKSLEEFQAELDGSTAVQVSVDEFKALEQRVALLEAPPVVEQEIVQPEVKSIPKQEVQQAIADMVRRQAALTGVVL